MSLTQAAEVFHRSQYGGTYIDEDHYQNNIRPLLENAIPHDLNKNVKQVFKQRFEYFNEFSLSKRLKMMVSNHDTVFKHYVPNWKNKIKSIVSSRNYYTHFTLKNENPAPDVIKLFEYREFLRMLLELEILGSTGISLDTLHNCAKDCQKYRWAFLKSQKNEI